MADENPDKKPEGDKPAEAQPTNPPQPPARPMLRQRLKAKFNKVANSEPAKVLKETAEDLKSDNKERVGFAVSTIIPGGWIAYYAHRHHKYKKKHENDDAPPEAPPKSAKPPKP